MSKEVQEAKEIIKSEIYDFETKDKMNYIDIDNLTPMNECEKFINAIETVLSELDRLQKENETQKENLKIDGEIIQQKHDENSDLKIVIQLMAEFIKTFDIDEKICKKRTEEDCYADIYQENACINCIKEYFENKAKES